MSTRGLTRSRPLLGMGLLYKMALSSGLVTAFTLLAFVTVILPQQERTYLENMESKAHGVSVFLREVAASAAITEDYGALVEHCTNVLRGDPTVEYLVLARRDGFGLIHHRTGWFSEDLSGDWLPEQRKAIHSIGRRDFVESETFQYAFPFDYSGIEWGWIHVGLSLESFHADVRSARTRTAWLASICLVIGVATSIVFTRHTVAPILHLRESAQRIANGDLEVRADVRSGDEVQDLAQTFNSMAQAVSEREKRMQAQQEELQKSAAELRWQSQLQELLMEISSTYISLPLDQVDSSLQYSLEKLGRFVAADRVYIFDYDFEQQLCRNTYEWCAPGIAPQIDQLQRVPLSALPGWVEDHKRGMAISICDVLDLSPESTLRQILETQGIRSLLTIPLLDGESCLGFAGFDSVTSRREYAPAERSLLAVFAQMLVNIQRRMAVEVELRASRERAQAASRAKSEFLANMSHEIRTPINGVTGMLQLLKREPLADRQMQFVTTALKSSETLLDVIGEVLDFSKIEAGRLELDHTEFSLRDTVDSAVRLFAERAEAKGIELTYSMAHDLPDLLRGDGGRLRQVLINLVGNAMKFTSEGEVQVAVDLLGASQSDLELAISVRDTGPGIDADKHEAIFESFEQGDSSLRRRHGGTGLGLTISRQLVTLMGGKIWIESEPGRGSTFFFTVRLAQPSSAAPSSSIGLKSPRDVRVLVVDDVVSAGDVVTGYLRSWGCEVTRASDALQAITELEQATIAARPYNLAVLDATLPDVDGYVLAQQIRADARWAATRLVLLSGFSVPSPKRLAESGIASVVAKPVRASDLYDAIVAAANGAWKRRRTHDPAATQRPASRSAARVLVVDDNEINREVAREMVTGLGHACTCLESGQAAIEMLEASSFDLVLMDCQMPGLDGYETTAAIRAREGRVGSARRLPIIALTAHALKGDREQCLAAGMDDYLSKPLQEQALETVLARWLDKSSPAAGDGCGLAGVATVAPASDDIEAAILARCRGKRNLASRLLRVFLEESKQDLASMQSALAGHDPSALAQAAHRLKGAAGNLALQACQHAAAELELLGRDGRVQGAELHLEHLRAEVERVGELELAMELV